MDAPPNQNNEPALDRLDAVLDRHRAEFLASSRGVLVDAVDQLIAKHGQPLGEQVRDALLRALEEAQRAQIEPFFKQMGETVRATLDDVAKNHAQPMLDQFRQALLDVAKHVCDAYTAPLLRQVQESLNAALDRVFSQHLQPVKELTRVLHDQFSTGFKQRSDELVGAVREALDEHLPEPLRKMGRRAVEYAIAMTLFCLAAVFVPLGVVEGLREMQLPLWAIHLLVGLAALLVGLVFYRRRIKDRKDRPAQPPSGK